MAASEGRGLDLQNLSTVVTVIAGIVSAFYIVGLLLLGLRLQQYGFPVETVISQLPQTFLAVVGLTEVGMPVAVVAVVYLALRLVTQGGRARRDHGMLREHSLAVATIEILLVVLVTGVVLTLERAYGELGRPWDIQHILIAALAGTMGFVMGWFALMLSYNHAGPAIVRGTHVGHAHRHEKDKRSHNADHAHAHGQVSDLASRDNAALATLSAMLAVVPLFVFNGITLPLTDVKLCPTVSSAKSTSGWLIGTTSDRFYIGAASSPRYIAAAPASNFTLLEGNEDLHLASNDPASAAPDVKAACPALPSPSASP